MNGHTYLTNDTPGNSSKLCARAALFRAVIPLIAKHVVKSPLSAQFPIIFITNDWGSSLFTLLSMIPGAADATAAKSKDDTITANTFIVTFVFFASSLQFIK